MLRSWGLKPHEFSELSFKEQSFVFGTWQAENKKEG